VRFLDLLYPKHCLGCNKSGEYICSSCLLKLRPVLQICPVCERGSYFGQTHNLCKTKYSLDGLTSFLAFEGIVRQAIHRLKYRLVTDLKDELFLVILRAVKQQTGLSNFIKQYQPIVTSIPLYWLKENVRGFNQSTLLGQAIAKEFDLKFSDKILLRQKASISQTRLSITERRQNIKDAFKVNPYSLLPVTSYLLVDDVWTTGATLKTACTLLKHSGAKKVWGLTIAR
jgi:competence protein ComFC